MVEESAGLWSDSPAKRLQAARNLNEGEGCKLVRAISEQTPMTPWPFAMPTTVNPYVMFLGPSPGNSPNPSDSQFLKPVAQPAIGEPHERFSSKDTRGFWDAIRAATDIVLTELDPSLTEFDRRSLMGKMNLGVGTFGRATVDVVEQEYLDWVPSVIVNHLKPKILVMLGLKSILKKDERIRNSLNQALKSDLQRPDLKANFEHNGKVFSYEIWFPIWNEHMRPIIVNWPQHPSRAPMTNSETWTRSFLEFLQLDRVSERLQSGRP